MFNISCPRASSSAKESDTEGRHHIKGTNLAFKVKYAVEDIDTRLRPSHTIFHSTSYQQILEQYPLGGTDSVYIIVYEEGAAIGVIYGQLSLLNLGESLNWDKDTSSVYKRMRATVSKRLSRRWFVVGNSLLAGNYGIRLNEKSPREAFVITNQVVQKAIPTIEKECKCRVSFLLYKDFSQDEMAQSECLVENKFVSISSEPSMVMDIPSNWTSFDDYMDAISSKYKKRTRTAYKKAKDLERRSLSVQEILQYQSRIHELYQMVAYRVSFNMVTLNKHYFLELKRRFAEDFQLVAYFLDGEMIGFCTTIKDYHETHAHFLGFDDQYTKQYQLYLNMLYDMVKVAIENGSERIDFARTAPEIKSSVGAVPKETYFFMKHKKALMNRFMPSVVQYMSPNIGDITYRSPFKDLAKVSEKKSKKKASAVTDSENY